MGKEVSLLLLTEFTAINLPVSEEGLKLGLGIHFDISDSQMVLEW
jgi:hypothetical protein